MQSLNVSDQRIRELAEELSHFLGRRPAEISQRLKEECGDLGKHIAEEWRRKRPKTSRQIANFYKQTDSYLYELSIVGEEPFRSEIRAAIADALREVQARSIFEFGGGIGTDAIWFTQEGFQCTYYDLPAAQTSKFAKWRFLQRGLAVLVVEHPSSSCGNDAVISLEVFEHVPNLFGVLRRINGTLRLGGSLMFTASFGKTQLHPLHLTRADVQGRFLDELLYGAGFNRYDCFGPEGCLYRTSKRRSSAWYDSIVTISLIVRRILPKVPRKLWGVITGRL